VQLTITGRHVDVTDAMRDYARQRAERLSDHFLRLNRMQVTLDINNGAYEAEFIAVPRRGRSLVAHARTGGMYKAIDAAADRLEQQLRRLKEKVKDHRNRRVPEEGTGERPSASL